MFSVGINRRVIKHGLLENLGFIQSGAPRWLIKLVYNSNKYGLWYLYTYMYIIYIYREHFRTIVFMGCISVWWFMFKPNYNWGSPYFVDDVPSRDLLSPRSQLPNSIQCCMNSHMNMATLGVYRYTGMPPYPVVYLFNDKPWTQLSYCWCLSVDVIWIPFCSQSFWFIIAVIAFCSPICAVHSISFQH